MTTHQSDSAIQRDAELAIIDALAAGSDVVAAIELATAVQTLLPDASR